MKSLTYAGLVLRALGELAHYDLLQAIGGFSLVRRRLARRAPKPQAATAATAAWEQVLCDAVLLATCLYWKRVLCLQRSVCLTRLLRTRGVAAQLIIGYREVPFLSHAWVEIGSRVVNDSPVYQKRLRVLHSL